MAVPAGGAGEGELTVGDGAGDELVGAGLLDGDGLSVGAGLLAGDGLLVAAGVAGGDVVGALTGDAGTAGVTTGVGSVVLAAELGNRVMTGIAAALCFATAGEGEGADAGEATARICGPRRPRGLTAALFEPTPSRPAELAGTTR